MEYTNEVVYLKDNEIARINSQESLDIKTVSNKIITPYIQELKISIDNIEKQGYPHFMLKEIFEQPKSIKDTMRGRIDHNYENIKLEEYMITNKKL